MKLRKDNITLDRKNSWLTLVAAINDLDYDKAIAQSKAKAEQTMDFDQAGGSRESDIKYSRQLRGVLGEMAVLCFITSLIEHEKLTTWQVERYDDIRTDNFKSPENEYDIRIRKNEGDTVIQVESRSSIVHDRNLAAALRSCHIIGSYASDKKSAEKKSDIYILPLFCYENESEFNELETESYLKSGALTLRLVAGCPYSTMEERNKTSSLGQGNTKYKVLEITRGLDMKQLYYDLKGLLQST